MPTCKHCGGNHPAIDDPVVRRTYREVRVDGRLIGWTPPGDNYPICAVILGPRISPDTDRTHAGESDDT